MTLFVGLGCWFLADWWRILFWALRYICTSGARDCQHPNCLGLCSYCSSSSVPATLLILYFVDSAVV
ncbi:hypothetical protein QBC43DRAFT_327150 [Cladorrhinum sp. PSN259]|nr:hypothetical protein QBC43DRAFT_327150 [Cladorrhinum sp. PSN259]